jgi:hypothetical protein
MLNRTEVLKKKVLEVATESAPTMIVTQQKGGKARASVALEKVWAFPMQSLTNRINQK